MSYKLVQTGSIHLISAAGLPAQGINPSTGQPVGGYIGCIFGSSVYHPTYRLSQTWGGGSDSYFEYLIKYARLSNTDDNRFADTWLTAVDSSITHLKRVSFVRHQFPTLTGGVSTRTQLLATMCTWQILMIRDWSDTWGHTLPVSLQEIGFWVSNRRNLGSRRFTMTFQAASWLIMTQSSIWLCS